jgi:GNAT superfamily N-acetyltransferase
MVNIRPATLDDLEALIELGSVMHAEGAYAFLPYHRDKAADVILEHLETPESQCVFVAVADEAPVGMLAGSISEYYFCDERIASDTFLFVTPEHRSWSAAVGLIRAFRDWATALGARELCLSISSNVRVERIAKLYERLGLSFVGGTFKQRLGRTEPTTELT